MIIPTFFLAGGDKKKGQSGIPLLLMYGDRFFAPKGALCFYHA